MPTIQYSALSARQSVHKLFTSCIRRGLVSRDSIVDGDMLPATEWRQRYLPCCQPAVFKFRAIWPTDNRWNRVYLTKNKYSPGSPAVATAQTAPKICHGQSSTMYSECSRFHPNWFTFGRVLAERVKTAKMWHKVNESSIRLKPRFK